MDAINNDSRFSKAQKREVIRWIARHDNPECKMHNVTYEVCDHGMFATCVCGGVLDLTNYENN